MSHNKSVNDRQAAASIRIPTPARQPLPRSVAWVFGAGDLTTSAPLAIVAFFQLFFLTDVARLAPGLAAWPILLGKLWDAFNDPLVGIIADRVRSRYGRRRVLLLIGAAPVGMSFFLMWLVPPLGTAGLVVYYTVVYVVFDTAYTVVHIAYNSLTPVLTSDYDEQSTLHGVRMVYSIGGSLLAVVVGTALQWLIPDLGRVFLLLGTVIGALIIVPPFLVARVARDHDSAEPPQRTSGGSGFGNVLRNRPFWIVMGIYLTSWTAVSIVAAVLVYYARYNLGVPDQAGYYVLVAQGVAILFIPVVVLIARRTEKRVALFVGFGTMIPILVAIGTTGGAGHRIVYLFAALLGLGIATAYVTPWSMIPEVIQWDERATGERREGSYYAIVSFFQKAGTAAALWLMARTLEASGYVTPQAVGELPTQPQSALTAIRVFISAVPSILLVLSLVAAASYPITREVQSEISAEIGEQEA